MCAFVKHLFGKTGTTALCKSDIIAAGNRMAGMIPASPLTESHALSQMFSRKIWIKWDSRLPTGAFKERGALHFLLQLGDKERKQGVCAASAGNHALGLSTHAAKLGIPCEIVMPLSASLMKLEATKQTGANVILSGKTFADAYEAAQKLSKEKKLTFVPAYDHDWIIAGQGVSGLELVDQLPEFDTVIIPIGGGGYAAGCSLAIKESRKNVRIIGVVSDWAEKARTGVHPTHSGLDFKSIADGIAVKAIGERNQPILEKYVDMLVSVNETSLARAVVTLLEKERAVVEGSGAAPLAALLEGVELGDAKNIVLMCSGSNIDPALLAALIQWGMADSGSLLRLRITLPDKPGTLTWITGIFSEAGANIIQVSHDRSYAATPGCVEILCVLEVRNASHGKSVVERLESAGIEVKKL